MKRYINVTKKLMSAFLAVAVLLSACKKDEVVAVSKQDTTLSDAISFDITKARMWNPDVIGGAAGEIQTKVANKTEMLPMECVEGGDGIEIYMYMEVENCPSVEKAQVETKSGESIVVEPEYVYGVYAFHGSSQDIPESYQPDGKSEEPYMSNYGLLANFTSQMPTKYWPGYGWMQFYAYSPYIEENTDDYGLTCENNALVFNYTAKPNVADHIDILAGGTDKPMSGNPTSSGLVEMTLNHILSKVQFKAGSIACGTITSISLKGIKNAGTYTLVDGKWELTQTTGDFVQPYVETAEQTLPELAIDSETSIIGEPFFFVPQTFPSTEGEAQNAVTPQIEIKISVTSVNPSSTSDADKTRTQNYTLTRNLTDFIEGFAPDKQYTFVITTPQEVDVEVTDTVEKVGDYPVKSNLVITNTGLADIYIRVAISGAWYVDQQLTKATEGGATTEQLMVGEWNVGEWKDGIWIDGDGRFDWGNGNSTFSDNDYWRKGNDGFYYYTQPLQAGQSIKDEQALFKTYTLTATGPMANSYLDLIIAVQAVYVNDCTWAWPTAISAALIDII